MMARDFSYQNLILLTASVVAAATDRNTIENSIKACLEHKNIHTQHRPLEEFYAT